MYFHEIKGSVGSTSYHLPPTRFANDMVVLPLLLAWFVQSSARWRGGI